MIIQGPPSCTSRARAALAAGSANILMVGDSVGAAGQGASVLGNTWNSLFLGAIRQKWQPAGIAGGQGFIPAWRSIQGPDSTWQSYSAASGGANLDWAPSLGYHQVSLQAGNSRTYPVVGTSVDLWYVDGSGSWSYALDGGSPITVTMTGATAMLKTRVALGSSGAHTITITGVSGTTEFCGLTVFNGDETSGVRLFEAGHYGYKASDFSANTYAFYWPTVVNMTAPDLVVIMLGGNDMFAGESSSVKARLQSIISSIRNAASVQPSIVVCTYYQTLSGDWATLDAQIRAVVTEDPTIGLIDFAKMGQVRSNGWWSSDATHASDLGHAKMAQIAVDALAWTEFRLGSTLVTKAYQGSKLIIGAENKARHSVYSSTPPSFSRFTDGTPSIRLGSSFYAYGSDLPDTWKCVGGRVRIPAASVLTGASIKIWGMLLDNFITSSTDISGGTPAQWKAYQSKTVTIPDATNTQWLEVFWDNPFQVNKYASGSNRILFIGYEFLSQVGTYFHSPSPGSGPILAQDGSNFCLMEGADRSRFQIGSGATSNSAALYGVDCIMEAV